MMKCKYILLDKLNRDGCRHHSAGKIPDASLPASAELACEHSVPNAGPPDRALSKLTRETDVRLTNVGCSAVSKEDDRITHLAHTRLGDLFDNQNSNMIVHHGFG